MYLLGITIRCLIASFQEHVAEMSMFSKSGGNTAPR